MNGMTRQDHGQILKTLDDRWWSRNAGLTSSMRPVYLCSCATSDITQPYHSLSYLGAALSAAGETWVLRDLGVEFWRYIAAPSVVRELENTCRSQAEFDPKRRQLLLLYAEVLSRPERFQDAWMTLSDPTRFWNLQQYLEAVHNLSLMPWLLTLLLSDSDYRTFSSASPPGYRCSHIDLGILRERILAGFDVPIIDQFYDHHARQIAALEPAFVGLTIPFLGQLEHSLALGSRLRALGVKVAMGGPMIAKIVKYADSAELISELVFACDWIIPGEGETAVVALTRAIRDGVSVEIVPNLIETRAPRFLGEVFFENLDTIPAPDYGSWDWELYASPSPGAPYSPTRGCYWNKCAFCDYGLAVDGPTSPWRTRAPDKVAEDLKLASTYVRRFFFAVDVLSPSYANCMSRAIIDANLSIKWMADFRLESTFNLSKVQQFQRSGCIGAAFGMESADQITLDSICKGTNAVRLPDVVEAFADAGVPVQLMGFLGFPGETETQAQTTVNTSRKLLEKAATVALGRFGLSKGSLVARHPKRYRVRLLDQAYPLLAIPWDLEWELDDGTPPPSDADIEEMKDSLRLMRGFPYPFLGATSTHHSLLWFERNPRAPFPIPHWAHSHLRGSGIYVVPAFERAHCEDTDRSILLSRLTGRALDVPSALADVLDELFPKGKWAWVSSGDSGRETMKELLELLDSNQLAMFLSEDEVQAAESIRNGHEGALCMRVPGDRSLFSQDRPL